MNIGQNSKNLFDTIMREESVPNDADLARSLGISASQLCNVRAGRVKLGPTIIVRMMEAYPISLRRIQQLLNENE